MPKKVQDISSTHSNFRFFPFALCKTSFVLNFSVIFKHFLLNFYVNFTYFLSLIVFFLSCVGFDSICSNEKLDIVWFREYNRRNSCGASIQNTKGTTRTNMSGSCCCFGGFYTMRTTIGMRKNFPYISHIIEKWCCCCSCSLLTKVAIFFWQMISRGDMKM